MFQIERRDPLAELAMSLATRQSAACDGEVRPSSSSSSSSSSLQALSLSCPSATKISIQLVQYGDTQQCPPSLRYPGPATNTGEEEQVAAHIE